jgi:predicted metal-dependent hydrolase
MGRQYRLKVLSGDQEGVKLRGRFFNVDTYEKGNTERVRKLLEDWYCAHARIVFDKSLRDCLRRFKGHMKAVSPQIRIRRMKKRWGSCTPRGVIYLNPDLVMAPGSSIDYVIMHEICHMIHPHHGSNFYALLRRVMPDWEARKERLEKVLIS